MKRLIGGMMLILITYMSSIYLSCKSKEVMTEVKNVRQVAYTNLQEPISLIYNMDSTFVLCLGGSNSNGNPLVKTFCVVDNKANLVYDRKTIHGNVAWHDTYTLRLEELPRVINKLEAPKSVIKYINVKETDAISQ